LLTPLLSREPDVTEKAGAAVVTAAGGASVMAIDRDDADLLLRPGTVNPEAAAKRVETIATTNVTFFILAIIRAELTSTRAGR